MLFNTTSVGSFKLKHRVVIDPVLMDWDEAELKTYCMHLLILNVEALVLIIKS